MNAIKARELVWKALLARIKDAAACGYLHIEIGDIPEEFYAELINLGYKVEKSKLLRDMIGRVSFMQGSITW